MSIKPCTLSDDDLVETVASLAAAERSATAALIEHLAELEARNLHLARGFRSLFGYCRVVLHCSEHEAYNRMEVVHAARRFPVILPLLAEGLLHLTAVRLLAPHLRDEDHLALLGGAIHASRRDVLKLIARWFPSEDAPSTVRRLPARETGGHPSVAREERPIPGDAPPAPGGTSTSAPASSPAPPPRPPVLSPLSADRYRLQITLDAVANDDLRRLQDMLRREVPDGDPAAIVARALNLLRRVAEKRAFSATRQPAAARVTQPASRNIPAAVQRAVWDRDEGQCAFEGHGRRCAERSFLEFHHVTPWAAGGPPSRENIALRCRAHNAYEAALYFGPIRAAMEGRGADSFRNETGDSGREPSGPAP